MRKLSREEISSRNVVVTDMKLAMLSIIYIPEAIKVVVADNDLRKEQYGKLNFYTKAAIDMMMERGQLVMVDGFDSEEDMVDSDALVKCTRNALYDIKALAKTVSELLGMDDGGQITIYPDVLICKNHRAAEDQSDVSIFDTLSVAICVDPNKADEFMRRTMDITRRAEGLSKADRVLKLSTDKTTIINSVKVPFEVIQAYVNKTLGIVAKAFNENMEIGTLLTF